jgi:hypothetical protein
VLTPQTIQTPNRNSEQIESSFDAPPQLFPQSGAIRIRSQPLFLVYHDKSIASASKTAYIQQLLSRIPMKIVAPAKDCPGSPHEHAAVCDPIHPEHEEPSMRIVCPALLVAAMLTVIQSASRAAELLPSDRPIPAVVDHYIDAALHKEGIKATPAADGATLIRRLTLDLVGRIPTTAEWRAFAESTDPDKRAKLVDRLMASPGFVRHQVNELDTMLMAGDKGSVREYLAAAIGDNRPWDQIFRELLLPDQTDKRTKPAAEYLRRKVKDLDRLTAEVSSTFFGVNISCAQCHDHPLVRDWKQDHFYGMKSFLSRTFMNGTENAGFVAERGFGSIRFKTTDDVERQARLMFLTGSRVDDPGDKEPSKEEQKKEKEALDRAKKDKVAPPAPSFSARAKLVEVALRPGDREFFAKAIVNRIWHRLYGQGLVMPLDQMHSANPASHPDLLAWLARDTAEHGYDLRRLIRGLVMSDAYARDSYWQAGEPPRASLFAVAILRPLTPAQLATSLRLATVDPSSLPPDVESGLFEKRIETLETSGRPLAASFTTTSGDAQIGVAEALFFSNSKQVEKELLGEGSDRLVGRLKQTAGTTELIDMAVRAVLSRPPDDDEIRTLGNYLGERTDRPDDASEQLVWALLTSSEFRFNH